LTFSNGHDREKVCLSIRDNLEECGFLTSLADTEDQALADQVESYDNFLSGLFRISLGTASFGAGAVARTGSGLLRLKASSFDIDEFGERWQAADRDFDVWGLQLSKMRGGFLFFAGVLDTGLSESEMHETFKRVEEMTEYLFTLLTDRQFLNVLGKKLFKLTGNPTIGTSICFFRAAPGTTPDPSSVAEDYGLRHDTPVSKLKENFSSVRNLFRINQTFLRQEVIKYHLPTGTIESNRPLRNKLLYGFSLDDLRISPEQHTA
jgi:hypothetical protein